MGTQFRGVRYLAVAAITVASVAVAFAQQGSGRPQSGPLICIDRGHLRVLPDRGVPRAGHGGAWNPAAAGGGARLTTEARRHGGREEASSPINTDWPGWECKLAGSS